MSCFIDANGGSGPGYWLNSFGESSPDSASLVTSFEVSGLAALKPYTHPEVFLFSLASPDNKNIVNIKLLFDLKTFYTGVTFVQ